MTSDFFKEHMKEMEKFDKDIKASRQISRNAIYRVVLLASAIVGFSVSLFSIPSLQQNLNLVFVQLSWYSFLIVIIFGSLAMLFEGRVRYGIAWKVSQTSQWVDSLEEYTRTEQISAFLITCWTFIYPANLTFNKVCQDEKKASFQQRVNGLVVHRLARLGHSIVLLENVTFIFFVIGLVLLIKSFVF